MIKLYACYKKLGAPPDEGQKPLTDKELSRVAAKTKVMLKSNQVSEKLSTKDFKKKAITSKQTTFHSTAAINQFKKKPGNIGYFVTTKKAIFDENHDSLAADLVDPEAQKEKKMIDYNVVKRGLNYHGANSNDLEKE